MTLDLAKALSKYEMDSLYFPKPSRAIPLLIALVSAAIAETEFSFSFIAIPNIGFIAKALSKYDIDSLYFPNLPRANPF